MTAAEFFLPSEVQAITRLRDPTRRRMEERGLFPARIRISPRRVGWRCADIIARVEDPEGRPLRHAANGDENLAAEREEAAR